jgi:hypothetical protein
MAVLEIFKKNHGNWEVTVTRKDTGLAQPLAGAKIVFAVKHSLDDEAPIFQRKNALGGGSDAEIEMSDPTHGIFNILTVPENIEDMEADIYYFDITIDLGDIVRTVEQDKFLIKEVCF